MQLSELLFQGYHIHFPRFLLQNYNGRELADCL
nr:MAG TPA: Prim-pol 4 [Caudoviricetes sp.]